MSMTRDQIFAALKDNIQAKIPMTRSMTILEAHSLRELGGDSLVAAAIVSKTAKQLGLTLDQESLSKSRNIADLLGIFEKAASR